MVNHGAQNMVCYTSYARTHVHTEPPYSALLRSNLLLTPATQNWDGGVEENAAKFAIHVEYLGISGPTGWVLNLAVVYELPETAWCQYSAWATPNFVHVKIERDGRTAGR